MLRRVPCNFESRMAAWELIKSRLRYSAYCKLSTDSPITVRLTVPGECRRIILEHRIVKLVTCFCHEGVYVLVRVNFVLLKGKT